MEQTATATFKPLPWQVKPWRDKSLVMLLTGAAGGGKSKIAAEKIHAYCLKYPKTTALMLRKTREWCSRSIIPFYSRSVVGDDKRVVLNKATGTFNYYNCSTVYTGGMRDDDQREAIRSIGADGGLDIVWAEEANAFSRKDFEEILGRLRGKSASWRQLILSTNPDHPKHWINADLIQKKEASSHFSTAKDNPYNPPDYLAILDRMTGIMRSRLRDGLWVQAEGAVYDEWRDEYLVDAFRIPAGWRKFRVIDFGFKNPFVCQWWALDQESGISYLYRELYHTKRTVRIHAETINRFSEGYEQTIADHDAEDRATLVESGINTIPAFKELSPGIQAVKQLMNEGKIRIVRGCTIEIDPDLESSKLPTSTEGEVVGYSWPKDQEGKSVKEVPVKINDHGMDATRYYVAHIMDLGKQKVGSLSNANDYHVDAFESSREMF